MYKVTLTLVTTELVFTVSASSEKEALKIVQVEIDNFARRNIAVIDVKIEREDGGKETRG